MTPRFLPMISTAHPKGDSLSPQYWRTRAQEVRQAIIGIAHPKNKKILEQVAKSYDEMADLLEQGPPNVRWPSLDGK
jgi:hypothetical protein